MKLIAFFMILLISHLAFSDEVQGIQSNQDQNYNTSYEQEEKNENLYGNPGENYYDDQSRMHDEGKPTNSQQKESLNQNAHKNNDYQS